MTTINKMAIAGTAALLALALFGFVPASASEVTGTLSAGASTGGGSTAGGTIGGGVSGGGTISGTVSGGSNGGGGGGGGGSNNGSVLGASTNDPGQVLAANSFPSLPNTGEGGSAELSQLINGLVFALTGGLALFDRKRATGKK